MDLLARREHSFHELYAKLRRKFPSNSTSADIENNDDAACELDNLIKQQCLQLAEENLQSDERFVESFINGRKAKGKGPLRIRQELEQKKIDADLLSIYLDDSDAEWECLAAEVYRRKFGDRRAGSYQEKTKRLRFMQYRGFSYELLAKLVI